MNVKGFRSSVRWRYIKDIIWNKGVRMVCLQEEKILKFTLNKCY